MRCHQWLVEFARLTLVRVVLTLVKPECAQRRESNWKKAVDEDGNEYSYDETSGRTTWSDKSQADDGDEGKGKG